MPIPNKKEGEKQQEFISRCMGSDVMNKEFPDQKQRAAVCYSKWKERKQSKANKEPKWIEDENFTLLD